jgi:ribonuclease HI
MLRSRRSAVRRCTVLASLACLLGQRRPRNVKARLYTDGGARGNPGPAAFAYVLEAENGTVLAAHSEAIGVATNNIAEYRALVEGLRKAVETGITELEVVSDSELVVKQMRGEYRVKNRALQDLFLEASRLARGLRSVAYTAVRREQNELADRLVNEALDALHP